ncbi:MAG TPA: zf-TFIIB domain-containing protein [Gemmatimonadales bacterium]|nr:zf-TFIIB domain-containing protein [Gemmatimonadales bacterium]
MSTEKPSRNEEEYFARLEAERLERRRREATRMAEDAERQSHHMRCPKCGGQLRTERLHKIDVDRCQDCQGVWLDPGEIEALVHMEKRGILGRALDDVLHSLKGTP